MAKREASPSEAKIAYPAITDAPAPGDPAHFTAAPKYEVYFRPHELNATKSEEDQIRVPLGHWAGCFPASTWSSSLTEIIWSVRWTQTKGLSPARPQVVLRSAVRLGPGAVWLNAP